MRHKPYHFLCGAWLFDSLSHIFLLLRPHIFPLVHQATNISFISFFFFYVALCVLPLLCHHALCILHYVPYKSLPLGLVFFLRFGFGITPKSNWNCTTSGPNGKTRPGVSFYYVVCCMLFVDRFVFCPCISCMCILLTFWMMKMMMAMMAWQRWRRSTTLMASARRSEEQPVEQDNNNNKLNSTRCSAHSTANLRSHCGRVPSKYNK